MGKILRLVFSRSVVVHLLLISVVFLSATQQVLPFTVQTIPLAYPEALPATYPKLDFSTYLGGSDGHERGYGIAVTEDGSCYLTGQTGSSDFPTQLAFNSTLSGSRDAFVTKLSSSGSLLWSTFFGGSDLDIGYDISVAGDGSCYVTGFTESSDFPTRNAYNSTYGGNGDIFLAKFSSIGQLLWSSYLGGNESDEGKSIAVAGDGSCYVTGETRSSDFPTLYAYDPTHDGGYRDAFVAKFSTNGTLLWSTYLGGNTTDLGYGIAVSDDGSCYVTGQTTSSDFPTLYAYDPTPNGGYMDAFVAKFSASGSLLWSTYLGGASWDDASGITVASDDSCYVTGYTTSSDFPTQNAYNSTYRLKGDAFVGKFSADGNLLWSTYLGGNETDFGYDITVTNDGSCYVTGETFSSNFPTRNAYDSTYDGYDAFVTKFSSEGFLLWSTYLGGRDDGEQGYSLAVTEAGSCFVTGRTNSDDFPTQNAYDSALGGKSDAFVTKFIDSPIPNTNPITVTGFLVFVAVMLFATLPVIALIVYKKRK